MRTMLIALLGLPLAIVFCFLCYNLALRETEALSDDNATPTKSLKEALEEKKIKNTVKGLTEDIHASATLVVYKQKDNKRPADFAKLAEALDTHGKDLVAAREDVDALRTENGVPRNPRIQLLLQHLAEPEEDLRQFYVLLRGADLAQKKQLKAKLDECLKKWKELNDPQKKTDKRAQQVVEILNNIEKVVVLISNNALSDEDYGKLVVAAKRDPQVLPLAKAFAEKRNKEYYISPNRESIKLDKEVELNVDGKWKHWATKNVQVKKGEWIYLNKGEELQFEDLPLHPEPGVRYTDVREYKNMLRPTARSVAARAYNEVFHGLSKPADVKEIEDRLLKECHVGARKNEEVLARIKKDGIRFVIEELQNHKDTAEWGRKLDSMLNVMRTYPSLFQ